MIERDDPEMRRADFEGASGSLDERVAAALAKVSLAARHELRRAAAREGLSAVQAQVLAALVRERDSEMGTLAARLGLTAPTVTDAVAALERRGLVRRREDPEDRRRVLVRATARGRRLGVEMSLWPDLFRESIGALAPGEKEVLFRFLVRLIVSLLRKGVIQDARMCATCAYFRPDVRADRRYPHYCALADVPLGPATLRVDCPEHRPAGVAASELQEESR
jgi:DNA-binding MarR family transcriptional regulator